MVVSREHLAEHFRLLTDRELVDVYGSGDLTEVAHEVAGAELARRKIDPARREPKVEKPPAAALLDAPIESDDAANDEDLVMVGRFYNPMDAYLLQSRLEAEGVPSMVADALTYQNWGLGASVVGGVRVMVPESYATRAIDIRKAIESGDLALDGKTDVEAR